MNTGSPKDEPNGQRTPARATMRTTAPVREISNQHDWQLWLRIRRTIANLFALEAKRSPNCSDGESKTGLTVTQEIYVLSRLEGMDHGYFYQQPLRNRDPLDQLLLPAGKEAKKAKGVKRD
jgi:hypothetical protein